MKAFDFDGVLVPDIDYVDIPQAQFEQVFLGLNPVFKPVGAWCIVTGRTNSDLIVSWLNRHLGDNLPSMIFANEQDLEPAVHKNNVLGKISYTLFVESDAKQVDFLQKNGKKVVHFATFIANSVA